MNKDFIDRNSKMLCLEQTLSQNKLEYSCQIIPNREFLEEELLRVSERFEGKEIPKPENWGGFLVVPEMIEFWQGRPSRLHDRLRYTHNGHSWQIERLAP